MTILGPWDTDLARRRYSYQTALSMALLGKHVGEAATMKLEGDDAEYTIEAIEGPVEFGRRKRARRGDAERGEGERRRRGERDAGTGRERRRGDAGTGRRGEKRRPEDRGVPFAAVRREAGTGRGMRSAARKAPRSRQAAPLRRLRLRETTGYSIQRQEPPEPDGRKSLSPVRGSLGSG